MIYDKDGNGIYQRDKFVYVTIVGDGHQRTYQVPISECGQVGNITVHADDLSVHHMVIEGNCMHGPYKTDLTPPRG